MLADRRFAPATGWWMRAFLLVIVLLAAGSGAEAVAAQPPSPPALAQDGRGLLTEPLATRAVFTALWGDLAPAEWIQEHDAALSGGRPVTGPRIGYLLSSAGPFTGSIVTQRFVAGLRDAGYSLARIFRSNGISPKDATSCCPCLPRTWYVRPST